MSIPLIEKPEKDDINTSIIAIKRNIERINMLLGLVDSGSDPDLSGLATKQELQDAITELTPVDEVTVDNMHSVTSNAVYKMFKLTTVTLNNISASGQAGGSSTSNVIPSGKYLCMCYLSGATAKATNVAFNLDTENAVASSNGTVKVYQGGTLGGSGGENVIYFESNGTTTKIKVSVFNYGSGAALTYSFNCYLLQLA